MTRATLYCNKILVANVTEFKVMYQVHHAKEQNSEDTEVSDVGLAGAENAYWKVNLVLHCVTYDYWKVNLGY